MDVKWTSEQKKVIDLRDRDILVSAAAGSGKTAVLVERIVNRICVDDPPVDIDRMLVVTFTKAAAAEMRERVSRAIDSLKEQKLDDENLQRQSTLVHNALITTIDSFCLFVVQNNFAQLNLDPDFRIGDQAELKLMLKDALAQVFEDNYAREDNEAFINLIDTYSKGRNDSAVRQMVEDIYYKAGSSSWPRKWMNSLLRLYDIKSAKQLEDSEIIKEIVDYSRVLLEETVQELTMAKDLASATPGLALHPEYLKNEPSVLLVDIGGWTVDLMRLDNAVPNAATCRSLELGVIRCIDETAEQVRRNTGLSVTETQIERVLRRESCSMAEEARRIIQENGRKYIERILSAVTESGFDLRAVPTVFMGGGSAILKRHVTAQDAICRPVFIEDVHANATGYERIVEQMWTR